ncbi:MAG: nucleotidyltransferase domain-containing protein [Euryarchaeota archaeon]|nr:nucleotidyltransferase domain-containing protein [Euryarchaeota archaeon]
MHPITWSEALLGTRAKVRILRLLASDIATARTGGEIARALDMSPNTVNLALKALRDEGILEFRRLGGANAIRMRSDLTVTKTLVAFFDGERETLRSVSRCVAEALPKGVVCYLFGSTARSDAKRQSDIDLLIVAQTQGEADEAMHRVREAVSKIIPSKIDIIALGAREAKEKSRSSLLENVRREGRRLSHADLEDLF